jgi:hypothetical protein
VYAQACHAWTIHKRLNIRETLPGYGRLITELP